MNPLPTYISTALYSKVRIFITACIAILVLIGCGNNTLAAPLAASPIAFQDVSQNRGINLQIQSFGAGSWGDFNGDGLPDLWLGNHAAHPSLFVNQGNGAFIDIAPLVVQFPRHPNTIDAHGAQWLDIDRDGDQDLIEMAGGRSGKGADSSIVWMNQAGQLIDSALSLGLDYPTCRGRTPLAFDWNLDGWLDILYTCAASTTSPSQVFTRQTTGSFTPLPSSQAFSPPNSNQYGLLTYHSVSQKTKLYVHHRPKGGIITRTNVTPWQLSTPKVLSKFKGIVDSAFADIDGDLAPDFIATRNQDRNGSDIASISANVVNLSMLTNKGSVITTQLKSIHDIHLQIKSSPLTNQNIFIGALSSNPQSMTSITLQVSDPNIYGMPSFVPGVDTGFYIGFDPITSVWTITQTSTGYTPLASIFSGKNIKIIGKTGFPKVNSDLSIYKSTQRKITRLPYKLVQSLVVADFDNDMDQDIYLVRSRSVKNLKNVLLINDGQGNFTETATGIASSVLGIGDAASTVDFNGDGLMDILVTNGAGNSLLGRQGTVQLLQNTSTTLNHWLEIDLTGTTSNIEGIGAKVIVTTPDGKKQVRLQGGGMHKYTQNHTRLHFGLAQNTSIDAVKIIWPNGAIQVLNNIPADQILHVVER